jgi:hypothetical protein
MRKQIVIFGTLLIAALVVISGSAVAPFVQVVTDFDYCTDEDEILGADDDVYASIGEGHPVFELGWVLLDLGSGNAMPYSQVFTVYGGYPGGSEETYNVYVSETDDIEAVEYVGQGDDTSDEDFTTPSTPINAQWRYIFIEGVIGAFDTDPAYGPDLDAVGY